MAVLPIVAVTLVLDGHPIRAYAQPVVIAGHTYAPLAPYVTLVAQELSYGGNVLVLRRDSDTVRVRTFANAPDALDYAYVAIAPLLRGLGAVVRYDPCEHALDVWTPQAQALATPTPFDPNAVQAAPLSVFTPAPIATPSPGAWSGPAIPRRTPIPYPAPT